MCIYYVITKVWTLVRFEVGHYRDRGFSISYCFMLHYVETIDCNNIVIGASPIVIVS